MLLRFIIPCLLTLSLFLAACGGNKNNGGGAVAEPTPSASLSIVSKGQKFDKKTLAALPNTTVTINYENADSGILHNVAVYKDNSAKEVIFRGEIIPGPKPISYSFTSPAPGNYFFRCDTHPDMNGTFLVATTGTAAGQ